MSDFSKFFSEPTPGAPFSSSRAEDLDRTVEEGKIDPTPSVTPEPRQTPVQKKFSKKREFILPPVVTEMSDEEYERRKSRGRDSNNGRLVPAVDWRPDWKNPKRPHARGMDANAEEIKAIEKALEESRPAVRTDWDLSTPGIPEGMIEEILTYIQAGGTMSKYCELTKLNYNRFWKLMNKNPELKRRYQAARTSSVDALADEALRIASEPAWQEDVVVTYDENGRMQQRAVKRFDNVYARKLAFQSRQWMLAKLAPERFGEKPVVGDTDTRAAKILAARKRLAAEEKAAKDRDDD